MAQRDELSMQLKRCPLCGGKPIFDIICRDECDVYGNVECKRCGLFLMGADYRSFTEQLEIWNNRQISIMRGESK